MILYFLLSKMFWIWLAQMLNRELSLLANSLASLAKTVFCVYNVHMYVILHCLTKQIKPYKNHNCKKLLFAEKFCSTLSNKIVCIILMPEANYIYRLIILVPSYICV